MKKVVLIFGFLSGAIMAAFLFTTVLFIKKVGFDYAMVVGYTAMVLAFMLVFFGIRSYRENVGGGTITFGRAFGVGILIMLISSACYVVAWEIVYFNFMHDFADKYGAHLVEQVRNSGAGEQAVQAKLEEVKRFKELYENPFFNAAITFLEPLPPGLLLTLISALILRKRKKGEPATNVPATQAAS